MNLIKNTLFKIDDFLKSFSFLDFAILFVIRIYLFFIFWGAGTSANKLSWNDGIPSVNPRFAEFLGSGGSDNLNFVFPTFFAWLVILAEAGGAIFLLLGLFTRWAVVPIIFAMFVAAYFHFPNGWNADAGGYEMAATYILILAIPLIYGGGNYLSLDYWVRKK